MVMMLLLKTTVLTFFFIEVFYLILGIFRINTFRCIELNNREIRISKLNWHSLKE